MDLKRSATFNAWALVLLGYSAYTLWLMFSLETAWFLVWSVPCAIGAVGLLKSRHWAQYIYYTLALCTAGGWAGFVVLVWPSLTTSHAAKVFTLGAVLVSFCAISSFMLYRRFRASAAQDPKSEHLHPHK